MLSLLFFEDEQDAPTPLDSLAAAWEAEPGCALEGRPDAPYRPGTWRHPATHSQCVIDLGERPLEQDEADQPRHYTGFRALPMQVHIPLSGAHWHCVEALAALERVLARLPGVLVLDTEDAGTDAAPPAPGPLDRLLVLGSWEAQMAAQCLGQPDLPRLDRRSSVAIWRYRRARHAHVEQDERLWPEALVLLDGHQVRPAAFWMDPALPLALPPVEVLVLRRSATDLGVLPVDDFLLAAGAAPTDSASGARLIDPVPAVLALFAGATLQPIARFRALDDSAWTD